MAEVTIMVRTKPECVVKPTLLTQEPADSNFSAWPSALTALLISYTAVKHIMQLLSFFLDAALS